MTREQRRAIGRLEEKIAKARESLDFSRLHSLLTERANLMEAARREERTTLREALASYTPEERSEATTEIIYAVATADLLYSATMEVEERLKKKFNIESVPILNELRDVVGKLKNIVTMIDKIGNLPFSLSYADIVTDIETKYSASLRNFIHTEITRHSHEKI